MAVLPIKKKRETSSSPMVSDRNYNRIQRDIGRLMEDFFGSRDLLTDWSVFSPAFEAVEYTPSVDVTESKKEYRVTAEIPGMKADDIELNFTDNVLSIRGEKETEDREEDEDYVRMERSYGSFYRSIPFSVQIEDNKIKAEYKNGLLHIRLPKAATAISNSKKIPVSS